MKTAIIFASTHGTTEKSATLLSNYLGGDTIIIDLKKNKTPLINNYDEIIIGGSIHAGMMQRKVTKFIKNNDTELKAKKIGLFLCCMHEGEKAEEQFKLAFPEDLRTHSVANQIFGGEFLFGKMNFLEKAIIKKMKGDTEDVSNLNEAVIKQFAETFRGESN